MSDSSPNGFKYTGGFVRQLVYLDKDGSTKVVLTAKERRH
jgi:hypothetical protein